MYASAHVTVLSNVILHVRGLLMSPWPVHFSKYCDMPDNNTVSVPVSSAHIHSLERDYSKSSLQSHNTTVPSSLTTHYPVVDSSLTLRAGGNL